MGVTSLKTWVLQDVPYPKSRIQFKILMTVKPFHLYYISSLPFFLKKKKKKVRRKKISICHGKSQLNLFFLWLSFPGFVQIVYLIWHLLHKRLPLLFYLSWYQEKREKNRTAGNTENPKIYKDVPEGIVINIKWTGTQTIDYMLLTEH